MDLLNPADLIVVENGRLITDSRRVALAYGKAHRNVLRDVRAMFDNEEAEIREHALLNFEQCFEINELANRRPEPVYRMTRDGFLDLSMSFTGNKAHVVRIRFIRAFN